jgi:type II secretory pathway pseudopilin PulG
MKRISKFRQGRSDEGYILLTILLWVAILSITVSLPMLTYFNQQMKRDREEELVHRGVEYERAIRKYFRKFGSYPASLDMLESTNHMRFLRRRYKDPLTGKDFKVLTQADVMTAFGAGIGGGGIAGAQTLGQPVASLNAPPPATADTSSSDAQGSASQSSGGSSQSSGGSSQSSDGSQQTSGQKSGTTLPFTTISGQPGGGQTFGGGGIVGVASTNTQESIRVYNKKTHYNEWLFAYNPSMDRGGLPKGPYEPTLQGMMAGQMGNQPGMQNGIGQQGFGQQGLGQQGFGQGTMGQGMQPNPTKP